jgi:hypothetical protein
MKDRFTVDDIVYIGDKIEVTGDCYPHGKVHILAQVQTNLFTLIELEGGNRICDPFPCKYGTKLRSGNISEDEIQMYGSFSLQDLHDAVASQSNDTTKFIGEREPDKYQYKIISRFCRPCVFEELAKLWNKYE